MAAIKMYPKNDQLLTVTGLTDNTGAPVTGATVTATLVDKATKTPQTGCTDVALTDVDGTPGSYSATIAEDFVSAPGDYILQVTAVKDTLMISIL